LKKSFEVPCFVEKQSFEVFCLFVYVSHRSNRVYTYIGVKSY
jgi:hypothetical protein